MSKRNKQTAYYALAVLLGVAGAEAVLQVSAMASQTAKRMLSPPFHAIEDLRIGQRGDPRSEEYDEKGFRNEAVPLRARIIALGDSQTYGTGVGRGQAWPQMLGRMLGDNAVYNMAWGGVWASPLPLVV